MRYRVPNLCTEQMLELLVYNSHDSFVDTV
jgi:hypothetical protein